MRRTLIAGLLLVAGIAAIWVVPAGRAPRTVPVASVAPPPPPPLPIDSAVTDFMTWVAGGSAEDTASGYRRYAAAAVRAYAEMRRSKLDSVAAFAAATLTEARTARTVLYPFAGGDVAYVTEFFPRADTIVLIGLEPPGALFDWRAWSTNRRAAFLSTLTRAVDVSNRAGFFLTEKMQEDFADPSMNGVVHPILLYLGWKGYGIVRLSRFDPADPRRDRPAEDTTTGLRVRAREIASGHETVFEYVRADLSDGAIGRDSVMVRYLRQWEAPVVYLKAASYLLHYPFFSVVRRTLADAARAVVQDDTGFPLAVLTERFTQVQVFGTYTGPIALFAEKFQADLKARYDVPGVAPLPFRLGYGSRGNLQYATAPKG